MEDRRGGDEDRSKPHSHYVADADHVVQFARDPYRQPHVDNASVPPGQRRIRQSYIDHAGRPTNVYEADGRTEVMSGEDQIAYFPDGPAKRKWNLVQRAEVAANRPWEQASAEFRVLRDEWKAAGAADRSTETALWPRFRAAMDSHFAARNASWSLNRSAKEGLVAQAEAASNSSDLKAAGEKMRSLGEEWKRIGPCDKADNDRLWAAFNAARNRLRTRRDAEFEERKRQWAANKSKKEALVRQMDMLKHTSDYRAAKEQARALTQQWKEAGPCDRADNERLWNEFSSSKTRLFEAARVAGEQRKAEAARRAWERVQRLEEQLRNIESRIYQTEANYSRALSARSPSMRNPNWHTIVTNQQRRQSDIASRLSSLREKRSDVLRKLMEARSRANSF